MSVNEYHLQKLKEKDAEIKRLKEQVEQLEDIAYPSLNLFKELWEKIRASSRRIKGGAGGQQVGCEVWIYRVEIVGLDCGEFDLAYYALQNAINEYRKDFNEKGGE